MSTRAIVVVKDRDEHLLFYRHSDGYPEGVKPTLDKFVEMVDSGQVRNNVQQAAGWLILLGVQEYDYNEKYEPRNSPVSELISREYKPGFNRWKVGAYEPTTHIHGDVRYVHLVDLQEPSWRTLDKEEWEQYDRELS